MSIGYRSTRCLAAITGVSIRVEVVGIARDRGVGVHGRASIALSGGYKIARHLAAVAGSSIRVRTVGIARDRRAGVRGRASIALSVGYRIVRWLLGFVDWVVWLYNGSVGNKDGNHKPKHATSAGTAQENKKWRTRQRLIPAPMDCTTSTH